MRTKRLTSVEFLLIIAIIALIASFVVRIFYGGEMLQWENNVVSSLGIDPVYYSLDKTAALLILFIAYVGLRIRKKRARERHKYRLPI